MFVDGLIIKASENYYEKTRTYTQIGNWFLYLKQSKREGGQREHYGTFMDECCYWRASESN